MTYNNNNLTLKAISLFALAFPSFGIVISADDEQASSPQRFLPIDLDISLEFVTFEQVGSSLFGPTRVSQANETLFGSAVALSKDGLRLAIGSSGYDKGPSSLGNGAVFLYDYNPSTLAWSSTMTIEGNPGESIGKFVALSGDGSRIAVRRFPDVTPNYVEIFDVSSGSLIGSPSLGCEATSSGSTVAISYDGNRVAISCERKTVNKGCVETYEWNDTEWIPLATIDGAAIGISNQGLFGWSTSFSKSGNRLAISAPLYSTTAGSNPINRRGLVRVFDYDASSGSWVQVGNELLGVGTQDRFGLAIDLSGDGSTLFVGNSRLGSSGSGLVEIFQFEYGSWTAKGEPVEGSEPADAFGVSISSSFDGNTFIASSGAHSNNRGQVRLMKFNGTNWNQILDGIEGLQEGDRFGDGRNVVSLSGDGLRLAAGSQFASHNGNPTGKVSVFDLVPLIAANQVSSLPSFGHEDISAFPSHEPSFFPSALPSLGVSSNNIVVPTIFPTVILDKFSWDIEKVGNATILFDESSETREISLTYNISLRPAVVSILDENCSTVIGQDVVGIEQEVITTSSTHGNLKVFLDIKQESIRESILWRDGADTTEGHVNMCVRVDLQLGDGTSVHFHEQKIYITVGLSAGFQVSQVDLERAIAAEATKEIYATYEVESCQCDDDYVCRDSTLVQGEDVLICVFTNATNIELSAIEKLDFIQGPLSIAAVSSRIPDRLTSVQLLGKMAVIRSQLRTAFFDELNPESVIANGVSSITFINGTSTNRKLSVKHSRNTRSLTEEGNASFEVKMALSPSAKEDGKMTDKHTDENLIVHLFLGVLVVAGVIGGVAFSVKKQNTEERNREFPVENPVI